MIELKVEPMLATYCPPGIKMKFAKLFLGTVDPRTNISKINAHQCKVKSVKNNTNLSILFRH